MHPSSPLPALTQDELRVGAWAEVRNAAARIGRARAQIDPHYLRRPPHAQRRRSVELLGQHSQTRRPMTPPVGMNVYVINSIVPETSLVTIFRGVAPFILTDLVRLAFPWIVLFLPTTMS